MPKLLIINITCNQGSTGKISEQVGLMMKQRGWDVYLAHGARRVNTSELKTIPFSSVKGEYLHALKSLLFDADGLGSTKATKRLVEKIKEIGPDVIQIHNLHGYYLNYPVLFEYLNSTNIPIVMTLHDCWAFTGHCVHFVIAGCEKWKTECHDCVLKNKYPKKSILWDKSKRNYALKKKYLASNANLHIVAVSEWLGALVRLSFLKNNPLHVFHNGIDLDTYKPQVKPNDGIFRILAVSNVWHKDKGLYDIYKLRELLPGEDYAITLVGLSERQIKSLPSGIAGITRTSNQQELVELYSNADVLINPTYADTFPTVNLEAMACGTPVVTYETGGSPESLTEKTGIVVKQGDVNGMAEAIKSLEVKPLSPKDCRKHAEERFDKDRCFMSYVSLYEQLLETNSNCRR